MPTIHALHPSGFLVEFNDVGRERLDEAINWLLEHGYRPNLSGDQWQRTPEGLPLCPKHGVVMAKREKQSDVWFSHKIVDPQSGQEKYCRGYRNLSSEIDGYDI